MEGKRKPSLLQQAEDGWIGLGTCLISKTLVIGDCIGRRGSSCHFCGRVKKIIKEGKYDPRQRNRPVFFLKKIPNRTYIHRSAKQAPGFKAWKDRLTLVLCGNAAGYMIKRGVVYRAKNPRAFKNKNKKILPVFWQHNLKAWVTAVLFTEWFHQYFNPKVLLVIRQLRLAFIPSAPRMKMFR